MYEMRRKDREIVDPAQIRAALEECTACCLAFSSEDAPYVVPMCYGYDYDGERLTLYVHCAQKGRKTDLLQAEKPVGFEMHTAGPIIPGENSCKFSLYFRSIVGVAQPRALPQEEKLAAFRKIMAHYTAEIPPFVESAVAFTPIFALEVTEFRCKARS